MKYFLDTEFIEGGPGKPIQLISIGMVDETGKVLYAISNEFREADASQWVRDNVLPNLAPTMPRHSLNEIAAMIRAFAPPATQPEFWGYYGDYDWVVFCQIFGTMMNLPDGYPMYLLDIKQLCVAMGDPRLPKQDAAEHNALNDALWNKQAWESLQIWTAKNSIA